MGSNVGVGWHLPNGQSGRTRCFFGTSCRCHDLHEQARRECCANDGPLWPTIWVGAYPCAPYFIELVPVGDVREHDLNGQQVALVRTCLGEEGLKEGQRLGRLLPEPTVQVPGVRNRPDGVAACDRVVPAWHATAPTLCFHGADVISMMGRRSGGLERLFVAGEQSASKPSREQVRSACAHAERARHDGTMRGTSSGSPMRTRSGPRRFPVFNAAALVLREDSRVAAVRTIRAIRQRPTGGDPPATQRSSPGNRGQRSTTGRHCDRRRPSHTDGRRRARRQGSERPAVS